MKVLLLGNKSDCDRKINSEVKNFILKKTQTLV